MMLPFAWYGNSACAKAVITAGYSSPVTTVRKTSETIVARSCFIITSSLLPTCQANQGQQHVDEFDADKRDDDAAHAVKQQVVTQQHRSAYRAITYTAKGQRD